MATHFSVSRTFQTLVKPSEPTPSGVLHLSVIDSIRVLRCNARTLHVFRQPQEPRTTEAPPADVIREALSRALVPYYPLAGRLVPATDDPLARIDCSGEGAWFVKAESECSLDDVIGHLFDENEEALSLSDQYQNALLPVFVGQSSQREPLVQMQVTQFARGGFVIGLIFCHVICDGLGAAQFLNAVGEKARALNRLSIEPVWCRDFNLNMPKTTSFDPSSKKKNILPPPPLPPPLPNHELQHANVDISLDRINELKREFLEDSLTASSFEIVAASCWMGRARAIMMTSPNGQSQTQNDDYKLVFFANCRQLLDPPLPIGFYGNCFFPVTITSSAEYVSRASLSRVVKLIQEAKSELPREFRKFIAKFNGSDHEEGDGVDPFAPPLSYHTLFISEWGRLGFNQVDYGWGPPVHVVPIQGSSIIPVGIVGSLPLPRKGVRLMTWCVQRAHLEPFLSEMTNLTHKR